MSIQKPSSQENHTKTQTSAGADPQDSQTTLTPNTPSTSTTPSTRPVGRPTKYKAEYCEDLINHMKRGLSFESFAGAVSVCIETIYTWIREYPEFLEAKQIGFSKNRYYWESLGVAGTAGKIDRFNSTAFIFNMKNRFPREWRDRHEIDHSGKIEVKDNHQELKARLLSLVAEQIAITQESKGLLIEQPSFEPDKPSTGLITTEAISATQLEHDAGAVQEKPLSNGEESS